MVQNGTPLSTIVNAIAQSVSSSVAKQYAGKLSQSQLASLQSSLLQSITNALSPPANAPPGTAAQQVAALAARLQNLVNAVARDTDNAGQQNELSGTVLDADSAKELPAQQKTNGPSSTLLVSSLVQSLLANAVATLGSTPGKPAAAKSASQPQLTTTALASVQAPVALSVPQASAAPIGSAPPSNASAGSSPVAAITVANAPDLLARMIVRAAGADSTGGSAAVQTNAPATGNTNAALSATGLASRFAAAIAEAATSGSQSGMQNGSWSNHNLDTASQSTSETNATNVAVAPVNVTTQTQTLLQPQQAATSGVDVNSVVEQMIKSMSMRTNAQGSSEIRLNLQPENLGAVTMRITVTGSQISANVIAQNADVRNALMTNHQQLARSLAGAGLTLTGFSVDVSGGDARQQQNQGQAGLGRRYTVHEFNGGSATDTVTTALGPPLDGGSGVALFNYLA